MKTSTCYKYMKALYSNCYSPKCLNLVLPKFHFPLRCESTRIRPNKFDDYRDLKINNVSLNNYIEKVEMEYHYLMENKDEESKRNISEMKPIIQFLRERADIIENLISLAELEDDPNEALRKLAESDVNKYKVKLKEINAKVISALLPNSKEDECNAIILEINAGVGGQEAMLFAGELFEMYSNFATQYKGWQVEVADQAETDIGGLRHGSLLISGYSVYQYFKYEAGVHRVQRIPTTEKGGRIHTSTVSVIALPQPTDIQINLQQKDLRIETKRASGAGGQHVNTTDSAVRITHIPTGLSVDCQVDRSQIKNRRLALTKLRTLLYQRELESQMADIDATKKSQVRSNFRNEKIRTYNFPQDRISDHRVQGNIHNIKGFLEGNHALEELMMRLNEHFKLEKLLERIDNKS